MPRQLTANAVLEKNKKLGVEPITIVGVFWNGTDESLYADKDLGSIPGRILNIGTLDEIIKIESRNTNASVEITLDDTDGVLKSIIDRIDIHKKPCNIYQFFDGLTVDDAFLVLAGEINTPIIWDEAERKLTFTILNKLESKEVGFAPEEGQFKNITSSFVGKVWPLAFGEVVHVPATKATEKIRGVTQTLIGIPDYTLPYKYWHLIERKETLEVGYKYYVTAIKYLNKISRQPDPIIEDYVETILTEDPKKQWHEDISTYIIDNEKLSSSLEKMLNSEEIIPQTITYVRYAQPKDNEGRQAPIHTRLVEVEKDVTSAADIQNIIDEIDGFLETSKIEIHALSDELERLAAVKKLLEIETDNAEYAYKNIRLIIKKIQKLSVEYIKTNHEIYKILSIMEEHIKIPTTAVSIIGGNKFPQNQLVQVGINRLSYSGIFTGNIFNVLAFEPRYKNIRIAPRQDNQLDAFWVDDPNINLKGHYCLITVLIGPGDPEYILQQSGYPINSIQNRIFKVTDQVGTKCVIDLVELKPSQRVKKQTGHLPLLEDLPNWITDVLEYAQEHTDNERERILENAIEKYEKAELAEIKKYVDKLKGIVELGSDRDMLAAINKSLFENVHEYNERVANLKFTKEVIDKASEKISKEEFKTLLKLCNLKMQLIDQESFDETEVPVTKIYYLTGFDIINIVASSPVMLPSWFQFSANGAELVTDKTVVPLPNGTRIIADFLPETTLWFSEPGSEVELTSTETETFVANILPSTIKSVYAYKAVHGIKQLVPLPKAYYVKNEDDFSTLPLRTTTVTLRKPLKDYPGEDWEDGIYVSMVSSVGPNTIDIIEWILTNYTNIVKDTVSFDYVKARLVKFPSNFCLFDKKDALQLIEEICWQARCTSYVRNRIMYLTYMSEEPISIATITEDDLEFGSVSLELSSTDNLITKFVAKWKSNYSTDKDNQLILRYNIFKYGEIKKEYDFYIYNDESLVNKSATFWLIRLSNIWKIAKLKTPLTKLEVETLDCVTLDLATNYFSNGQVKAIVTKAGYDSSTNDVSFECWLPIRSGEMIPYDFAFPADIAIDKLYPSINEINAGYAGSFHSSVPKNIAYKITANTNLVDQLELRPKDYGEAFPADAAFTIPNSPLGLLDEADYIVTKPIDYQMPSASVDQDDIKPEYKSPSGILQPLPEAPPAAFMGKIKRVIENPIGQYEVETSDGKTFEVNQIEDEDDLLDIGQPVTVVYEPNTKRYLINEDPKNIHKLFTCIVRQEFNDYLNCVIVEIGDKTLLHSSDLGGSKDEIVKVAKPRLLQKTPFHNRSINYGDITVNYFYGSGLIGRRIATATGLDDESQVITPPYFVGDIITVRYGKTGYEGINAIDTNEGGREWALIPS